MEKFIPYEKLSKKERRKLDAARRSGWNGISPVTRRAESAKVYNRKRIPRPDRNGPDAGSFFAFFLTIPRGLLKYRHSRRASAEILKVGGVCDASKTESSLF